jgi:hypothetical protein
MEAYLAGTAVNLTVPLQDSDGNALNVASLSYRVVDQNEVEKVAITALTPFVAAAIVAVIPILAGVNTIAAIPLNSEITSDNLDSLNTREIRVVELRCLLASGNTVLVKASYAVESADTLLAGINSFQSLPQAELTAMNIPAIPGWVAASDREKVAAMIAARHNINKLRFAIEWGQGNINYGTGLLGHFNTGDLSQFTPVEYDALPARLKAALRLAQVAESDALLGGDPVDVRRREGLLLESIGEVKQMFRSGKPIDLPVSKRALRYLSAFVSLSRRIGRD